MDGFVFVGTEVVLALLMLALIYAHESEKTESPKKTTLLFAIVFNGAFMFATLIAMAAADLNG